MAVANLTGAEWQALVEAALLQNTIWEQDGDEGEATPAMAMMVGARKRASLQRAMRKAGQLAPPGTFRWRDDG